MTDLSTQDDNGALTNANDNPSSLSEVVNKVGEAITDIQIPKEVRDGLGAAFKRLCIASIDPWVAKQEGKAAEIRAESDGRLRITNEAASQICKQMNVDPGFAIAASAKFAERIVRKQTNLNNVVAIAADEIKTLSDKDCPIDESGNKESTPISEDWFNNFEKEACQKSTEQMQFLFGKILAGEIKKPSSFSLKTIRLIGQLDQDIAKLFQTLCSLAVSIRIDSIIIDARVISFNGNAAQNSLKDYGITFGLLNKLEEYGFIISDYNSMFDYKMSILESSKPYIVPLTYKNISHILHPLDPMQEFKEFRLHGVAFTSSGRELISIIDIEPNETYTLSLKEFFKNRKLSLLEVQ